MENWKLLLLMLLALTLSVMIYSSNKMDNKLYSISLIPTYKTYQNFIRNNNQENISYNNNSFHNSEKVNSERNSIKVKGVNSRTISPLVTSSINKSQEDSSSALPTPYVVHENNTSSLVKTSGSGLSLEELLLPSCQVDYTCKNPMHSKLNFTFTKTAIPFGETAMKHPDVQLGGSWSPMDCVPQQRIALVIPYSNRLPHLQTFIGNIFPFLKRQKKSFTIFLVEQIGPALFNRAYLMDIGFVESLKRGNYSCFIMHDVDMVPVHLCNMYDCQPNSVRHLGLSRNLERPAYIYLGSVGGACSVPRDVFEKINGFTTVMFGWGGEDDDALKRIQKLHIPILRQTAYVGNYYQVHHSQEIDAGRGMLAINHAKYMKYDGLNTMFSHKIHKIIQEPLFTRIIAYISGPVTKQASLTFFKSKRTEFDRLIAKKSIKRAKEKIK